MGTQGGRMGITRTILAVLLSGIWINLMEFARNQLLLLPQWGSHFAALGLVFPSEPVNAVLWMAWGFVFASAVLVLSLRFGLWGTTVLAWVTGFVMMWLVTWNLGVLPPGILPIAVPLSFLEAFGAAFICRRFRRQGRTAATA